MSRHKIGNVKSAKVFCQDRDKHKDTIELIEKNLRMAGILVYGAEDYNSIVDLIIAYGGDGTMMRATNIETYDPVVLGINGGNLGFLTAYNNDNWHHAVADIVEGKLFYEDRLRLDIALHTKGGMMCQSVFNDIYIKHGENPRLLNLNVRINDQDASTVAGDGIIVSTPSGSTGYNLGARGPIISSGTNVMAITPICPHSLTNLPMITSELIKITFVGPNDAEAYITFDGVKWAAKLEPGDYVEAKKSRRFSKIVPPENSVFKALQKKMNWSTV